MRNDAFPSVNPSESPSLVTSWRSQRSRYIFILSGLCLRKLLSLSPSPTGEEYGDTHLLHYFSANEDTMEIIHESSN